MPVEELAGHIERWREVEGGGAPRLRVIADTARTLNGLSEPERRVLARGVADHGLPELAARIGQPGGMSSDDARRGARALLALDRSALDGIAADVRSPEGRQRLLDRAESASEGLPLPAAGQRLADLPPPPGSAGTLAAPDGRARVDAPPPPGSDAPDPAEHDPAVDDPAVDDPDALHIEGARAELPDLRHDRTSEYQPARYEPRSFAPRDYRTGDRTRAATSSDPVTDLVTPDVDLGGGSVTGSAATLHGTQRRREGSSPGSSAILDPAGPSRASTRGVEDARDRLAAVRAVTPETLHGDDLLDLLVTVPDGWERRRVLRRLLDEREVDDVDAAAVLDHFARPSDRIVAAAALVEADLASTATVVDRLPPRAAIRLARREANRSR